MPHHINCSQADQTLTSGLAVSRQGLSQILSYNPDGSVIEIEWHGPCSPELIPPPVILSASGESRGWYHKSPQGFKPLERFNRSLSPHSHCEQQPPSSSYGTGTRSSPLTGDAHQRTARMGIAQPPVRIGCAAKYILRQLSTETYHVGSDLGKVPIQVSRNKSHNYMVFGPIFLPPIPSNQLNFLPSPANGVSGAQHTMPHSKLSSMRAISAIGYPCFCY